MRALAATFVLASVALPATVVTCGCDAFDSSNQTAPQAEAGAPPADAASTPGSPDAATDAGGGDADCLTVERVFEATKDTGWSSDSSNCSGTIPFGAFKFLNLPSVAIVFRDVAPIDMRRVTAMRIELDADPSCTDCIPPLPTVAGDVLAFPMRVDWDEANADACRRTGASPGKGWGNERPADKNSGIMPGVDYDGAAGTITLTAGATKVSAPLTPAAFLARFPAEVSEIGVLLNRVSPAMIVIASKENTKALRKPRLVLTTCVPK